MKKLYFGTCIRIWIALSLILSELFWAIFFLMLSRWRWLAVCAGIVEIWLYVLLQKKMRNVKKVLRQYLDSRDDMVLVRPELHFDREWEAFFENLRKSLDKKGQISAAKKQAQYLALQNQINPHFLYNTLECIRGEAVIKKIDSVAAMTEALATFFRYTISKVENLVTVEDELNNVENYYFIQHYRFGDKLSIEFEYDAEEPEILQLYMPKLILQPIVENAIYHGIERKMGIGHVVVRLERTQTRLLLTVSDDGVGIDDVQLAMINRELLSVSKSQSEGTERGGIAISNVNNRIKLLFGEGYGVYIRSVRNVGTDVEITLPVVLNREQQKSV